MMEDFDVSIRLRPAFNHERSCPWCGTVRDGSCACTDQDGYGSSPDGRFYRRRKSEYALFEAAKQQTRKSVFRSPSWPNIYWAKLGRHWYRIDLEAFR